MSRAKVSTVTKARGQQGTEVSTVTGTGNVIEMEGKHCDRNRQSNRAKVCCHRDRHSEVVKGSGMGAETVMVTGTETGPDWSGTWLTDG